ncbi:MAG: hypothetical protein ACOCUH_01455 [Bacteriovoracia bacterium]
MAEDKDLKDKIEENLRRDNWGGKIPAINIDSSQETTINIRPSKDVNIGMFKKDPLVPGGYIAHPNTIKAMRKDLWMAEEDLDRFEYIYMCESCKHQLDLQFWEFCPYCGKCFPKDIVEDFFRKVSGK